MHAHAPQTLEVAGRVEGAGLEGRYHSWLGAQGQRYDQTIGVRLQSTIRTANGHLYAVDENGNVREMRGLLLERQRTEDFIGEEKFTQQPQYDTFKGVVSLPGGRQAYDLVVSPPDGLAEDVFLDTKTLMLDRESYDEADGTSTVDMFNYKVYGGALVPTTEIDSNGDAAFDLKRDLVKVIVDRPIDKQIFEVPKNNEIVADGEVTVPLDDRGGHYFTNVTIHGHKYVFLVDTGAQAIVIDPRVAHQLGLTPEGKLEVSGAQRIGGLGIAALDALQVGSATLPLKSVSVLDLHSIIGAFSPDGVLGYPFFASAEVEFDAAGHKMRFARPGMLHARGSRVPIDVDRSMIEMQGRVNGVNGRFILDTGNSGELLLFAPFMQKHPNLIPADFHPFANSYGVGGNAQALAAYVDELDVSDFRFFNRFSDLMLAQHGAFADRFAAGNIGMGVLSNLVVTFDVANAQAFVTQAQSFDDGRYRARREKEKFIIP